MQLLQCALCCVELRLAGLLEARLTAAAGLSQATAQPIISALEVRATATAPAKMRPTAAQLHMTLAGLHAEHLRGSDGLSARTDDLIICVTGTAVSDAIDLGRNLVAGAERPRTAEHDKLHGLLVKKSFE